MNKSFFIETYGCQMNVSDSELMSGILSKDGYTETKNINNADIILVNTCAIREHAEDKIHSRLGFYNKIKEKRPSIIIGVLGCMAQNLKENILESKPYVDIVLGPDSYRNLLGMIKARDNERLQYIDTNLSRNEVYENMIPHRNKGVNAWISIMRGCDKFCTFCVVPFTRGRERSRSIESIFLEASKAVKDGFLEITLLGQNVNSYNHSGRKFEELLVEIAKIPNLKRIRYTSPHPQDMTQEVLDVMAKFENICNYIHLPLQAGNNNVLKRMNRTYTKEEYLTLVNKIHKTIPDVGLSTDIIVGFPGENDMEFQETLDVMELVRFDSAYTFKYSARPGTKAAEYEDHVSELEKQIRLERVISTQRKHTMFNNKKYLGKTELILVEKESKKSNKKWAGRTDSNKWVIFDKSNVNIGDIVPVLINEVKGLTLHGNILSLQEMEAA